MSFNRKNIFGISVCVIALGIILTALFVNIGDLATRRSLHPDDRVESDSLFLRESRIPNSIELDPSIVALRSKARRIAQDVLVAKYEIHVTTDEIREYIRRTASSIPDKQFQETKIFLKAQLAAVEEIYAGRMTVQEAAEKYLHFWGDVDAMAPILEQFNTKEKIEEMRRMTPDSIEDMIEKSVPGHRRSVEAEAVAKKILSVTNRQIDWRPLYDRYLLDYAIENLIGVHPELKGIKLEDVMLPDE